MTTECQQWKKRYQTDTTCKVQCGAAQEVISGIALPPNVIMFPTATPSSRRRLAYDDPGTNYSNLIHKSIIYNGPASDSLQFVDFLLCLLKNTKASDFDADEPAFIALIDETQCEPAENGRPLWMSITLDVSRVSNTSPMTINGWVTTAEGEYVIFKASVIAAPTVAAPNGVFSLTYNFVPNWESLNQNPSAEEPTRKGNLEFYGGGRSGQMILIDKFVDDSGNPQTHYIKGSYLDRIYRVFNGENYGYMADVDKLKIHNFDKVTGTCWSMSNADIFGDCQTKLYDSMSGDELKLKEAFEFTTANGLNGWWNHRTPTDETADTGYTFTSIWYQGHASDPVIKLETGDTITRRDGTTFTIQGMDWTVTGCDYSDAANACKSSKEITLEDSAGDTFSLDAPISLGLSDEQDAPFVTRGTSGTTFQSFEYPGESGLKIWGEDTGVFATHECSDGNFPPTWKIPGTSTETNNCVKWRRIFHIKDGTLLHAARVDATGDTCVFASGAATCTNPDDGTSCNAHITNELTCTTTDGVNARVDGNSATCVFVAATGATCKNSVGVVDSLCTEFNTDSVTCRWTVASQYRVKNAECTNFIKQLPEGTTDCSSLDINDVPEVVTSLEVSDITSGFGYPPENLKVKYKHGVEQ